MCKNVLPELTMRALILRVDTVQHSEVVQAAYQTLQDVIAAVPSTPATSDKHPPSLMSPL